MNINETTTNATIDNNKGRLMMTWLVEINIVMNYGNNKTNNKNNNTKIKILLLL